jgi:hypothetical protein
MTPVTALPKLFVIVFAAAFVTRVLADVAIDPEVLEAVAKGRARVIVELHLEGGFALEGTLTEQGVRAQRAAIAAGQEAVLSELADGDPHLMRRPETVPFLSLEIGAPALAVLRAMPDRVIRILMDDTAAPERPQKKTGERP